MKSIICLLILAGSVLIADTKPTVVHGSNSKNDVIIDAIMPPYEVTEEDAFICTAVPIPTAARKLVAVEPLSEQLVVHHMLLFGCEKPGSTEAVWNCKHPAGSPCHGPDKVMYGWGKNAPKLVLPEGVGYGVGAGNSIDYLVLQIHYLSGRAKDDASGVKVTLTEDLVPFGAGMLHYASGFVIPPKHPSYLVPNKCCYNGFEHMHGFAFRVHTHALGRSVYLDREERDGKASRLCEHSPQLPQAFTPVTPSLVFRPGDRLQATCDFDSSAATEPTPSGNTHTTEMCNLYMMLWGELPYFVACLNSYSQYDREAVGGIRPTSVLKKDPYKNWNPPEPLSAPPAVPEPKPAGSAAAAARVGQVSGVARGHDGSIWLFHRGARVWTGTSFTGTLSETATDTTPIPEDAILRLHSASGLQEAAFGAGEFIMPHMITVAPDGALWVTDVGLHQAVKFSEAGQELIRLGKKLEPGHDESHFCKPTHVAVANDGTVYVADGYCNNRVVQFSPEGTYQGEFKLPSGDMNIPHSVVLDECISALYVADRENSKVHRFSLNTRTLEGSWDLGHLGQVYAIARGPYGTVLALCWQRNGDQKTRVTVLSVNFASGEAATSGVWEVPGVEVPHDLALVAAPPELTGAQERAAGILVAETRPSGSKLHRFVFVIPGVTIEEDAVPIPNLARRAEESEVWQEVKEAQDGEGGSPPEAAVHEAHLEDDGSDDQREAVRTVDDELESDAVVEEQNAMSSGGALSQIFVVGLPFVGVFGLAAFFLWRRLGPGDRMELLSSSDPEDRWGAEGARDEVEVKVGGVAVSGQKLNNR